MIPQIKYYLFAFVLIIYVSQASGQNNNAPANVSDYNKMSQILPPPPNAASLGKYGGLNTNLSSGGASISIPLQGYSSKSINVPISLNYSSNGVKVDEIASRAGLGWVLNCGGVITRTAYGNIDDYSVGAALPSLVPSDNLLSWMDALANPANVNAYSQPDIFRFDFDGYSGKFILDTAYNVIKIQGSPVLLTYSALKIQTGVDGNQFKITTPEGVQYFFGSSTSTEYSYNSPYGSDCGRPYNYYSAGSAFYLSKIVHPDNDTVNFVYAPIKYNYKTSVSETIYSKWHGTRPACENGTASVAPQDPYNTACVNWLETRGVLLQEISSTKFGKVTFSYATRSDYNDRLVSGLQYFKPGGGTAYKSISLNYQYSYSGNTFTNAYTTDSLSRRPFLKNIIETSADGLLSKRHIFNYNDINALPPRLSFAQDAGGFFNGKNNSTLIPLPTDPSYKQELPQATASRSVDPNYSLKGLLTSVTYPTGGKDSLVYESNQAYEQVTIPPQNAIITATAYNQTLSGGSQVGYSGLAATAISSQQATLTASCASPTAGETNYKTTRVYFTNETTGEVLLNQLLQYNQSLSQTFVLPGGYSYKLKVTVSGENTTGTASLAYQSGQSTTQWQNVNLAGARVTKVVTTDNATNTSNIKKYSYASGRRLYSEQYQKMLKVRFQCTSGSDVSCTPVTYEFYSMHSNPIYGLNDPFPVMYANVTESFGENYENGGIEHQFTDPFLPENQDFPAGNAFGDMIPNPPVTSFDFRRGRELYQGVFKKQGGNNVYSKKTFYHFKEDPRIDRTVSAFVVNKNFKNQSTVFGCTPVNIAFNYGQYNLLTYAVYQKWVYTDTVKTWNYDSSGQNYTEEKTITEYGNPATAQPTKITSFTSDRLAKTQTNFYPADLTLTGDAETARQLLIAKKMSPALQQKVAKNDIQQFLLNTEYNVFPNGLVLPKRKIVQIAGNTPETRIEFNNYDSKGNILEASQANGTPVAYLWGYSQQYPVAEIKNATYQAVINAIGQTAIDQLNTTPGSDAQVRSTLNALRTALPNTQMTTYTYEPLVGMTSMTDAKGQTTYYEYDGFQRLIRVKDRDGNIVKQMDYHYQQ